MEFPPCCSSSVAPQPTLYRAPTVGQAHRQDGRENPAREQQPQRPRCQPARRAVGAGRGWVATGGQEASQKRALNRGGGASHRKGPAMPLGYEGLLAGECAFGARQAGQVETGASCRPVFCQDCWQEAGQGGRLLSETLLFQTKLEMWIFV